MVVGGKGMQVVKGRDEESVMIAQLLIFHAKVVRRPGLVVTVETKNVETACNCSTPYQPDAIT